LINKKTVAALKLFGGNTYRVSEIDRLLIDKELLEGEGHRSLLKWRRG
jgi:hypothetical protein